MVGVLAGGCGTGGSGASSADRTQARLGRIMWRAPESGQPTSCSVVAGNTEVIVFAMLHDVSPACAALRDGLSSGGPPWSNGSLATVDRAGSPIQFTIACALTSSQDDEQITVVAPSSGTIDLGRRVCARFAGAAGWRRGREGTTTTLASAGY
jgi:hypothetical protein